MPKSEMEKNRIARILIYCGIFLIFFTIIIFSSGLFSSGEPVGDKLALIEIPGLIVRSNDVIDDIKRYNEDRSVKAIILRIDSPGGVVAPTQEIYRELNKIEKKVIVSMGSVAASGGYYIACTADRIFANPGTLTGSIGVIMNFPRLEGLTKKIGIDREIIKSGEFKDSGSPYRNFTPDEKQIYQEMVDDVYDQFLDAVYEGRKHTNLTREQIKSIADGRVMSGRQALQYKLVDELGGFEDAVNYAAKISGIKGKPKIIKNRPRTTMLERLIGAKIKNGIDDILGNQVSIRYELPF
ncbi:MAG: Signal peptide peptidase SppA [Candidatus Poribacteria bacterium]|nr:Signal peptide peptidase SppA [Candidatus Poribacteria bacterium]